METSLIEITLQNFPPLLMVLIRKEKNKRVFEMFKLDGALSDGDFDIEIVLDTGLVVNDDAFFIDVGIQRLGILLKFDTGSEEDLSFIGWNGCLKQVGV